MAFGAAEILTETGSQVGSGMELFKVPGKTVSGRMENLSKVIGLKESGAAARGAEALGVTVCGEAACGSLEAGDSAPGVVEFG